MSGKEEVLEIFLWNYSGYDRFETKGASVRFDLFRSKFSEYLDNGMKSHWLIITWGVPIDGIKN